MSRIIERGNWKLVWENNRECYHCKLHPELGLSFPEAPTHSSGNGEDEEFIRDRQLVEKCEKLGLPSKLSIAENKQHRAVRIALKKGFTSMTLTGKPAVLNKTLGGLPSAFDEDIGDVVYYNFPTTWNHFQSDHAITFRMMPISPTETELVSKWLVPKDAIEGVDYHLKILTEVWLATNTQDEDIVAKVQNGVKSSYFQPGPYNMYHEGGVTVFVDWYCNAMKIALENRKLNL